ncbi:MAG: hypothetical protein ACRDRS_10465 [Pseudonocardiaceae bacterium]
MQDIVVYPEVSDQIAVLPNAPLEGYDKVASVLEVSPWDGPPHYRSNPEGNDGLIDAEAHGADRVA